jgi:hypothetical protein
MEKSHQRSAKSPFKDYQPLKCQPGTPMYVLNQTLLSLRSKNSLDLDNPSVNKIGLSISDPRQCFIVPPSFVSSSNSPAKSPLHDIIDIQPYLSRHHPILLIHRMLPFSAGLDSEALCPSHGISIIEQPSFVFSLPSIKDIFLPSIYCASPSIPRIIIAALRNLILMVC